MYLSLYIYIHMCMYTYICMYICTLCMYVGMYVCMYACMYVCMHACMYVYVYIYTFVHIDSKPIEGLPWSLQTWAEATVEEPGSSWKATGSLPVATKYPRHPGSFSIKVLGSLKGLL